MFHAFDQVGTGFNAENYVFCCHVYLSNIEWMCVARESSDY